jgi:hypothetical protein
LFEFKNKAILILSPEDWGKTLLSKHLYAKELSKNNKIFFLHTSPHPSQKKFIETCTIEGNIEIIHLKKVVKGIFKLPPILIDLQNRIIIKKIQKIIQQQIDVVWSFDQSKFQNLRQFNAQISIFHPVDYIIKANPFVSRIANSADLVFSVSQAILDIIKTKTPKYFINHGLDEVFLKENKDLITKKKIVDSKINVGYVGNLNMKFIDYENLIKTVEENTHLNFIFIGPENTSNIGTSEVRLPLIQLKELSNTQFIGAKSKEELITLLPFFDIFLLCYNNKKYPIEVSNSHKILEYLSTGKVIVSNSIKTYDNNPILEIVSNNASISARLNKVSSMLDFFNSTTKMNERITFAKENTYKKQLERIEKIINT